VKNEQKRKKKKEKRKKKNDFPHVGVYHSLTLQLFGNPLLASM
jgi:hypothetical protein